MKLKTFSLISISAITSIFASSSNEDLPGAEALYPRLSIISATQSEIEFTVLCTQGERYSFNYSTDLESNLWNIEEITITIPEAQNLETESDRYTFTPTENEISIVVQFTEQTPSKAFFQCKLELPPPFEPIDPLEPPVE